MTGQPGKNPTLNNPNFITGQDHKPAEKHEEQRAAAEPGWVTDRASAVCLLPRSFVNNEGIEVISEIPWNSMSECLIWQSESVCCVCLSQSLVMKRISINGSECRTFSERSTLSSAFIQTKACLLFHGMLCYIITNYNLENPKFLFKKEYLKLVYSIEWIF